MLPRKVLFKSNFFDKNCFIQSINSVSNYKIVKTAHFRENFKNSEKLLENLL